MPNRNDLSDLNLGEFSICFEDLGGPANEDCTIEFVKSKTGLAPDLKETDMSDVIQKNDEGEGDAELEQFANEIIEEFNGLSEEDQVEALVGMALENAVQEEALEDATEVIKAMTEAGEEREAKFEELKKSTTQLIEKMKSGAKVEAGDDILSNITKSLGGEGSIPDDVRATISDLVKAKEDGERKDIVTKARTWAFGKAEDVADLYTRIAKGRTTKEDAVLFESLMKQAGQVVAKSGLFKSIGEDAGNADSTDPIAKAKAGVEEIKKANPNLSNAQADALYWERNPDEYAAYTAARRAA